MARRMTTMIVSVAMPATLIPAVAMAAATDHAARYSLTVVSSPPELVSGDDARLSVEVPAGQIDKVAITVEGRDVTDAFAPTSQRTPRGCGRRPRVG